MHPGTCLLYGDHTLHGRAHKWPTFASPQWNVFTTPLTPDVTPLNSTIVRFQSHSQDSLSSFASSKFIIQIRVGAPLIKLNLLRFTLFYHREITSCHTFRTQSVATVPFTIIAEFLNTPYQHMVRSSGLL